MRTNIITNKFEKDNLNGCNKDILYTVYLLRGMGLLGGGRLEKDQITI